jgi:N-acetyl-gamma-glutamyl-phosphate reductase
MKIFVDGQVGTTGLKIHERLEGRPDLTILRIDQEKRKDIHARKEMINEADIVFLCLPDTAAKEAVKLLENPRTKIIDASTAHRTADNWAYGLPELSKSQRETIRHSRFVSVPGCHATGFALALYPLIVSGVIGRDYPVTCFSLTGYSGGGKKLIEQYEPVRAGDPKMTGCRPYALNLKHKHLPEMTKITGLDQPPVFNPVVGPFAQGMIVTVPLVLPLLKKKASAGDIHKVVSGYYSQERFISVMPFGDESTLDDGFLDPQACNGTNRADIFVFGHDTQASIMCRLDNLGKGASGAAVQCMNIMIGCDEGLGLSIY